MTNYAAIQEDARDYIRHGLIQTDHDTQHLAVAIYRLLASGSPVTRAELANVLEMAPEQLDIFLAAWPSSGIEFDADGSIVAFGGLSLSQTAHSFVLADAKLYTWCVLDALFLPEIIGTEAILETNCAMSGQDIEVRLNPDGIVSHRPDSIVMSVVAPDGEACRANLRVAFCQHVNLFHDKAAFREWSRDREDVAAVSLREAHALGAERNASRYPDANFLNRPR